MILNVGAKKAFEIHSSKSQINASCCTHAIVHSPLAFLFYKTMLTQ